MIKRVLKIRCPKCDSILRFSEDNGWFCLNFGCDYKDPMTSIGEKSDIGYQKPNCGGSINPNKAQSILPNLRDLHNRSVKFIITKDGKVDWKKRKGFKGSIYDTEFKGFTITKGTNYLIIHYDKRNLTDENNLPRLDEEIVAEMVNIAAEVSSENKFEINPTPIFHRIEIKTPLLSDHNFNESEAQAVYPCPGPIEFKGINAIKNEMSLTQIMNMDFELHKMEIYNKQLHQKVLEHMDETLTKIEQAQPKKPNPFIPALERLITTAEKIRCEINGMD